MPEMHVKGEQVWQTQSTLMFYQHHTPGFLRSVTQTTYWLDSVSSLHDFWISLHSTHQAIPPFSASYSSLGLGGCSQSRPTETSVSPAISSSSSFETQKGPQAS